MRDIDLKTLRLLVAVCDLQNMARAAEQENIEPSAVSKRIAQLESDLGTPLLSRGRRGVEATPAGLAVLEHARNILFSVDRIVTDAATFSSGMKGHVRLLASASAIAESLLDDIAAFLRESANANIKVDVEERMSRDLIREVRDGQAAVGVCWENSDLQELERQPYRNDRLALAVHPDHPLAAKRFLRFEQTLEFDHVGLLPTTAVHAMLQRAAARVGKTVSYRAIVSNFDASFRVVASNLAISVIPVEVGRSYAQMQGVKLIPLTDKWAHRTFAVCYRNLDALQPAVRRMVDHLVERARTSREGSGAVA